MDEKVARHGWIAVAAAILVIARVVGTDHPREPETDGAQPMRDEEILESTEDLELWAAEVLDAVCEFARELLDSGKLQHPVSSGLGLEIELSKVWIYGEWVTAIGLVCSDGASGSDSTDPPHREEFLAILYQDPSSVWHVVDMRLGENFIHELEPDTT